MPKAKAMLATSAIIFFMSFHSFPYLDSHHHDNAFLSNELEYEAIESAVKFYLRAKAPGGLIRLTGRLCRVTTPHCPNSMLIPFRSILVGTLLIATHLGVQRRDRRVPHCYDIGGAAHDPECPDSWATGVSTAPLAFPRPDPTLHRETARVVRWFRGLAGSGSASDANANVRPGPGAVDRAKCVAAVAVAISTVKKYEVQEISRPRFVDRFQTGYRRAVVEKWLTRSGQYLPMILDVFRQKGLPDELVLPR